MAVKWAVANGNWADGTTWNDGVVPTSGDFVYCNGYTISFPTTINIGNGTITNELNPNTNRNGGHIQATSGGVTIIANLIADSGGIFGTPHLNNSIIGDVTIKNCTGMSRTGNTLQSTWRFTGNISVENGQIATDTSATYQVVITGNAILKNRVNVKQPANFTINGNIMIDDYNITATNLTINGLLTAIHCRAYGSNVVKSGNIHYISDNSSLTIGIAWQTLNISNISEWRDISEPRSNPFIILTDAEMNNRQQYPAEDVVKQGVEYVWGEKVGTYQQPPESVVLKGFVYDNGDKVGSLENQNIVGCVTKEDVREGVELIGLQEVGTLVVPSVDDVREGVVFDNGSVGTLIIEGGGDRLRIANFGYYTDSQSDTYIVDINDSFKQMFATAEESVLLELFPELDLDNIPDKYFDDLFVKYLKYRLIVEYYRGAGINSVFTPSELTTEVVNYQNVRCEYWLNLANIYLNAWNKKYPNSIKKQRILL